jgi:hypothetical protein
MLKIQYTKNRCLIKRSIDKVLAGFCHAYLILRLEQA